jgi:hypothetical protein
MKRRQLLMLAGGTAATAVVVGATAPPAQAFLPLLIRFAIGQGIRQSLRKRQRKLKGKKGNATKIQLQSRRLKKGMASRQTRRNSPQERLGQR